MPISLKREQVIVRDLLFVLIVMGATTTPAFAGTIISPLIGSPVTATAVIDLSVGGGQFQDICQFSLSGSVVDGSTITFDSGNFDSAGNENCTQSYYFSDFPVTVKTIAGDSDNVRVSGLNFATPSVFCFRNNLLFDWSNAASKATSGIQIYATCKLNSASLTISPAVTITP